MRLLYLLVHSPRTWTLWLRTVHTRRKGLKVAFGAAYGTSKAGVAVMTTSILRPDRMIQNTLPVLMAGIIAIYGLVAGIIITDNCIVPLPLCVLVPLASSLSPFLGTLILYLSRN